ncbi:MAG: dipeptidyl aminopeptidase/acylaminoacyl peptidase, partial [Phenylobacterium sp.]
LFRRHSEQSWQTIAKADSIHGLMPFNFEAFDKDDPALIYVSAQTDQGRTGFFKYDTKKAVFGERIAAQDNADITELLMDRKGRIYGYGYFDEHSRRVYWDTFWQSVQKMLTSNFAGELARVESISDDKNRMFIHTSSPTNPGSYYFFDVKAGSLTFFAEQYPLVDSDKLAKMHPVSYKARDGLTIPGFLSLPAGLTMEGAKKLPTVIQPHGGPRSRDYWGYDYWVQFLTTRGYAVLQMNYRGSTGYGDEFEDRGKQQWGGAMIDDINDGTEWLIKQGISDPDKICIVGWSYGGYAALQAPIVSKDLYKCAVAGAAVTNMPSFLLHQKKYTGYRRYRHYIKGDGTELTDISPEHNIDKLNLPVLMLHGTKDRSVPYKQATRFVDAMKDKDKNIQFVTMEDTDHHLSREKDRLLFLSQIEQFLAKHLD